MATASNYEPRTVKNIMKTLQRECGDFEYYEIRINPQWRRVRTGRSIITKAISHFTVNMKVGDSFNEYRKIRQQVHGSLSWNYLMTKINTHKNPGGGNAKTRSRGK